MKRLYVTELTVHHLYGFSILCFLTVQQLATLRTHTLRSKEVNLLNNPSRLKIPQRKVHMHIVDEYLLDFDTLVITHFLIKQCQMKG